MGWVVLPFAAMMAVKGILVGSAAGTVLSFVLMTLTAPPIWKKVKALGVNTYAPARWSGAVVILFVALLANAAAYSETPEGKAAEARRAAEEQAKKDREDAELAAKQAAEAAAKEASIASGDHCLSGWDDSFPRLKNAVERSLRNPSSFEHIETVRSPVDAEGKFGLIMTYRAENGFGGMNVEVAGVEVEARTCNWVQVSAEALARRLHN